MLKHVFIFLLLSFVVTIAAESANKLTQIAVISIENRGGLTDDEAFLLTQKINTELAATKKFRLIERSQIEEILKEQGFQQSGACESDACLVKMGQILTVEKIVTGTVGKLGNMFMLYLKMVNVQSGVIEQQVSKELKTSKTQLLKKYLPEAVLELALGKSYIKNNKKLVQKAPFWITVGSAAAAAGGVAAVLLNNSGGGAGNDSPGNTDEAISIDPPTRPEL